MGKPRDYAGFWHMDNDEAEKSLRELNVLIDFLKSVAIAGDDVDLCRPASSDIDPPDCIAYTFDGGLVGVEITELIDWRHVTLATEKRQDGRIKEWTQEEFQKLLNERLLDKDQKKFIGGPFERLVLIIHTDEWGLDRRIEELLDRSLLPELQQIDEVYLLQSHNPGLGRYPYFRIL